MQAGALVVVMVLRATGRRLETAPGWLSSRAAQAVGVMLAFLAASFTLFWIDPADSRFNPVIRLLFDPPYTADAGDFGFARAGTGAVLVLAAAAVLTWVQARLGGRYPAAVRVAGAMALGVTVTAAILFFFDFSLTEDTFHYLTNVGPALATMHGATPMVDAFSQYGPGPVIATLIGFQFGPMTFGTAQMVAQIFNLLFYGVWIVCLYRMTAWKLAALPLGFMTVALYFALWQRGIGNVNDSPSLLGLRHLPELLMVLALSCLRAPQRHSIFTALLVFTSGLWSVETLIGTLGIQLAFLGLIGLRDRAIGRLIRDGMLALVPVAAAVIAMSGATLLRAGVLPDLANYLRFLSEYNMLNESWAIVASPLFFGWLAMLLAVFIVMTDAWTRVLRPQAAIIASADAAVFYRYVPMAMLLMVQAAYFVGRSVDYTLDLALFPFAALVIAGGMGFSSAVATVRAPVRLLLVFPVLVAFVALEFAFLSLFRQNAPYVLALHECRYFGRCSPNAMAQDLRRVIQLRSGLEKVGNTRADYWLDTSGIVRAAMTLIETWAPNEPKVTALLGNMVVYGDEMASDMALMYTGKWHRWPRSTFSDLLVPPLAEKIITAPVRLREGELVLVRSERKSCASSRRESGSVFRPNTRCARCHAPQN